MRRIGLCSRRNISNPEGTKIEDYGLDATSAVRESRRYHRRYLQESGFRQAFVE